LREFHNFRVTGSRGIYARTDESGNVSHQTASPIPEVRASMLSRGRVSRPRRRSAVTCSSRLTTSQPMSRHLYEFAAEFGRLAFGR
jgi:hypothetical protein